MQNSPLLMRKPNEESRHGGITNAPPRRPRGQWSVVTGPCLPLVIGHFLIPGLAWAHGDNNLTAGSFLGPLLFVAVLAVALSMGRPVIRWLARRG